MKALALLIAAVITGLGCSKEKPKSETEKLADLVASAVLTEREAILRASCQNHLKQLGLICKMYSNESRGMKFPSLEGPPNSFRFKKNPLFPEYLDDPTILVCPSRKNEAIGDPFSDNSYWYLGFTISNDQEFQAFAEGYEKALKDGGLETDMKVAVGTGCGGGDTVYVLREGVERFFVPDNSDVAAYVTAQIRIPVIIERPGSHHHRDQQLGINVLFMDGHVEYMPYPGAFPASETVIKGLERLEKLEHK